jgi:hypothetical protein
MMLKSKNKPTEMDEEISVGGGATGVSKVPGPIAKGNVHANRPQDKSQGDGSAIELTKVATPGQSEEDTDTETNTKPTGDNSAKNKSSVSMKASAASAKMEEVESELKQLFGEETSAEFVTEASALFAAAINERVASIQEDLEEQYNTRLDEEVEAAQEAMVESIDKYLSYAIAEWIEENKLAVESNLRAEIAEEFIDGLKGLFAEHYIEVPKDRVDVVAEMSARIEELEALYNEKTDEVIGLQSEISEAKMVAIVESMTDGLAVTQAEKLKTLCEGLNFEDEDTFARKVAVIKENYFSAPESKPMKMLNEESFDTSGEYVESNVPVGSMGKYVRAISRTVKS